MGVKRRALRATFPCATGIEQAKSLDPPALGQ